MARLSDLFALARGEIDEVPESVPGFSSERRVEPSGPLDALIAVIGEAPGYEEAEKGEPFVGKSGKKMRYWARKAGVDLSTCYMDNVYPYYPPAGKIKNIPADKLAEASLELWQRLSRLHQLRVIVPTGNIALKALLNKDGITKHRGSIYPLYVAQRQIKAIPLIHPAAVLRGQAIWERRCHLDWERIAAEAKTDEIVLPVRHYITQPTMADLEIFMRHARQARRLAIDIETKPSEGRILCVGFSLRPDTAVVLPWSDENAENIPYISWIKGLCALPCDKVLWNHLYDRWWLAWKGIPLNGRIIDGMTGLHALMPTDNVGLAYTASILTREPYWKDDKKDEDNKTAEENWEQFKRYCGTDVATTLEIAPKVEEQLREAGLVQFHREHYEELAEPMLDLMLKGVRIDHTRRKVVLDELLTEARAARDKLMAYNDGQPLFTLSTKRDKEVWAALQIGQEQLSPLGWLFSDPDYRATVIQGNLDRLPYTAAAIQRSLDTIAAKTVSREKLKDLVYNKYGLPIQFKKRDSGEETETLDIFTLQQFRLSKGTAAVVRPILDLAIEHTKKQKLATFIYDNKFDEDGRMRFSLKVTTEAGRLASSASPRGKKVNSQNIPREKRIRNLVLPEEGHVCVEYDYSQAEARICFVYTKDPELVELARKHPSEFDQHRYFAATIFGKPENEIDKVQRQVAKSCVHGKQRQLQGKRLSETLLKEGFVYSEEECEMMLQTYDKRFPGVRRWQEQVRRRLWKHRLLVNSWGRRWPVPYYELNDELLRRGLSFILQSDNADNLNILGFKSVHYWLKAYGLQSRIMLQEHDALVMSCPLEELYDVTVFVYKSMEQTRQYDDVELSIPVEMKLGCCWGDGVEYKKMPSRDQLETSAEGIISTAV